jgi:hypothetical protein
MGRVRVVTARVAKLELPHEGAGAGWATAGDHGVGRGHLWGAGHAGERRCACPGVVVHTPFPTGTALLPRTAVMRTPVTGAPGRVSTPQPVSLLTL